MRGWRRYTVQRCDEGGTLFDMDDNPIDHTWDVVDRTTGQVVHNLDTRKAARDSAHIYESEAIIARLSGNTDNSNDN